MFYKLKCVEHSTSLRYLWKFCTLLRAVAKIDDSIVMIITQVTKNVNKSPTTEGREKNITVSKILT
jgi:hypothetical protein